MADSKISALTAVTTPALADELPVNQSGTSKKMTLAQMAVFVLTNGDYSPGSFTVPTGSYSIMVKNLILTGSQRATIQGDSRLRIL